MSTPQYREAQTASGLTAGDTVRIMRMPVAQENGWDREPDVGPRTPYIGEVGKITSSNQNDGCMVRVSGRTTEYYWPYFVLTKQLEAPAPAVPPPAGTTKPAQNRPAIVPDGTQGHTVIIFDSYATLIGRFSKAELEKIISQMVY